MICDLKECGVCYQNYDSSIHLPMSLPQCGHTICKECCDRLFSDPPPKCPFDRKDFLLNRDNTYQKPQVNNYALNNLQKLSQYKLCSEHNKSLKYMCSTDKQIICKDCFLKGAHKKHDVTQLEDLKETVTTKRKKLEDKLKNLDDCQAVLDTQLTKRKFEMLNTVDEYFENQVSILKRQKQETQFKIIACFENEKDVVLSKMGKDSNIRKSLNEKITAMKGMSHPDLPKIVDEDTEETLRAYDRFLIEQNTRTYASQMERVTERFKQRTNVQQMTLPDIRLPSRESLGNQELENSQPGTTYIAPELKFDIESFEVESYLQFEVLGSSLTINFHKTPGKKNIIDMRRIKHVKIVVLNIAYTWLLENDLEILDYVISRIEVLKEIRINYQLWDAIGRKGVEHNEQKISFHLNLKLVLGALLSNLSNVESLRVEWQQTIGNSLILNWLYENLLVQSRSLTRLRLVLFADKIDNFTIEDLLQRIQPLQENLLELDLDISYGRYLKTPIDVVLNLPKVRTFGFHVKRSGIINQNCENFLMNSLATMQNVQAVSLTIQPDQNTPEVKLSRPLNIIKQLRNVTELTLYAHLDQQNDVRSNYHQGLQNLLKRIKAPLLQMKKLDMLRFGYSHFSKLEFRSSNEILKALQ